MAALISAGPPTNARSPWPGAATRRALFLGLCMVVFLAPALISLVQGAWQTESGSLAPIVLALGGWTLWHSVLNNREATRPGSLLPWAIAMIVAGAIGSVASAIQMSALSGFAAWLGGVATFYALYGSECTKRCAFPLLFLALVIPAPYALTMRLNADLRSWLADWAIAASHAMGFNVAGEHGAIIVEQYVLAVENACAGANSTLSLVAIGLLYAYWVMRAGWTKMAVIMLAAVPIALVANVARVVFLIVLVAGFGSSILDSAIHPVSGVVSFSIALALLTGLSRIVDAIRPREAPHQAP